MADPRIIPCLLLTEDGLVKTRKFTDARYIGDPINTVRIFNEKEVDELVVFDIEASARVDGIQFDLLEKLATECRMPLTYGGGIFHFGQAEKIISMGFEKISLSSAAFDDTRLISELAVAFGSQSVVACIDYSESLFGKRSIRVKNSSKNLNGSIEDYVQRFIDAGVGEIIFNSINRDGMMKGYDLDFADLMVNNYSIPMTFLGGAGSVADMQKLVEKCGNVGCGAGSMFVYKGKLNGVLINYLSKTEKKKVFGEN